MKKEIVNTHDALFLEIKALIDLTRSQVSQTVNSGLTLMYWNIGKKINNEVLKGKRATYGKQVVVELSKRLVEEYGSKSFQEKNLRRMMQFAGIFSEFQIVVTLSRQLSYSHFMSLITIKQELKRDFYAQMCRIERWNVRTLRKKIKSMLFERTAISQKPEALAKLELQALKEEDKLTPDLVFRNPYILDFLGLKDVYQEKDLEKAILKEIEQFILELGRGFAFLERQKRMIIDGNDYKLDLLFYHRKLRRLVAIDLKLGKFEAAYKGQMELYLRWLEKNETEPYDEQPIGLLLCAEGNREQVKLLQLDRGNIRVAEYITQYLSPELLKQKLHQFMATSKKHLDGRGS